MGSNSSTMVNQVTTRSHIKDPSEKPDNIGRFFQNLDNAQ